MIVSYYEIFSSHFIFSSPLNKRCKGSFYFLKEILIILLINTTTKTITTKTTIFHSLLKNSAVTQKRRERPYTKPKI
jgi:hypothetical protein